MTIRNNTHTCICTQTKIQLKTGFVFAHNENISSTYHLPRMYFCECFPRDDSGSRRFLSQLHRPLTIQVALSKRADSGLEENIKYP